MTLITGIKTEPLIEQRCISEIFQKKQLVIVFPPTDTIQLLLLPVMIHIDTHKHTTKN